MKKTIIRLVGLFALFLSQGSYAAYGFQNNINGDCFDVIESACQALDITAQELDPTGCYITLDMNPYWPNHCEHLISSWPCSYEDKLTFQRYPPRVCQYPDCIYGQEWDNETQSCEYPSIKATKNTGVPFCEQSPDIIQANPINIGTGNKYQRESDYRAAGVFPLSVSRAYNSDTGNWRFFPEIEIITAGAQVTVIRPDGKGLPFRFENDVWGSDPDVTGTLTAVEDATGALTGWTYTTGTDRVESYDAQGRLQSVTARNGLSHSYAYTADSITVTHTHGAVLTYQLDTDGRVVGFTDPDSHSYQYSYDSEGRLSGITFPDDTPDTGDNPTRVYHYENSDFPTALTGITDENGNRAATWTYDSQGRAISSEHAGGVDNTSIDYSYAEDPTDPRVTVTNPLGKQTTYHLTTLHDVYKVTSVEGHPTASCLGANKAYTYDANGFVASKTDWKGNITSYTRDSRGRELTRTEAAGTPEERTVTTEWHPDYRLPTRITEPGKITEFTYDTNGNLLTRQERSNP